jgi:hypothetical protein
VKSSAGSVSFRWRRLFTVNAYGVFTQIHDVNQKNNSFHWKIKNIRERLLRNEQSKPLFFKSHLVTGNKGARDWELSAVTEVVLKK